MNVYTIEADMNFYRSVGVDGVDDYTACDRAIRNGQRVGSVWRSAKGHWTGARSKGDVAATDLGYGIIAINDRCRSKIQEALTQECELLPITVGSDTLLLLYVRPYSSPDGTLECKDSPVRFRGVPIESHHIFRVSKSVGSLIHITDRFLELLQSLEITGLVCRRLRAGEGPEEPIIIARRKMSAENARWLAGTKRGRLLLGLWETVINPCGEVRWVEDLVQRERARTSEADRILAETAFTMLRKGVSMEEFAKWARGIAYSVVFAVAVALDEEGAYSRGSLSGLFREFSPDHWDTLIGRRQRVAERLWKDAIVYFESEEWWTAEIQSVDDTNDFPFLTDAGKVMKNSLSLGVTSADWKAAALAMAIQVTHKTLQAIDELESFSPASLGGLHEDILMANPHGTS